MTDRLLDADALRSSDVVANCAMNRERQLTGVNSYERELGFNPLDWLLDRLEGGATALGWLDLCCGTGRPLQQAAGHVAAAGMADRVRLVGVDLVDFFDPSASHDGPRLVCAPVDEWQPAQRFDLVTCVHGMHYIGDKLGMLVRAASWLTEDGMFVADLDLASVLLPDARPAGRNLATALRRQGFTYDPRRRRISRVGHADVTLPYGYLGADDRAGPNYTGQPAVNSVYGVRPG